MINAGRKFRRHAKSAVAFIKIASRVVNYIQQNCGWKPYRMLTPTGMSEADPLDSNDTASGKAQNRRVAVNILVSKGLDGL